MPLHSLPSVETGEKVPERPLIVCDERRRSSRVNSTAPLLKVGDRSSEVVTVDSIDGWSQGGRSWVRMKHLTSGSASKHERVYVSKFFTASHVT